MTRPRILIADDHRVVAEGLKSLLEGEYEIAGIVEDGEALLAAVPELKPDLVIADVSMPGLSGIDCLRRLRQSGDETPVVLLTMHAETEFAVAALQEGATGYVLKAGGGRELKTALEEALRGGVHVSSAVAREVMAAMAKQGPEKPEVTPRQRDVLSGLARGLTAKEIAAELHLSPRTVEAHKYQLMERLGIQTSAELIQYALRHGMGPA
jgi:DNA-binding NarL/FixJ family response regulator